MENSNKPTLLAFRRVEPNHVKEKMWRMGMDSCDVNVVVMEGGRSEDR